MIKQGRLARMKKLLSFRRAPSSSNPAGVQSTPSSPSAATETSVANLDLKARVDQTVARTIRIGEKTFQISKTTYKVAKGTGYALVKVVEHGTNGLIWAALVVNNQLILPWAPLSVASFLLHFNLRMLPLMPFVPDSITRKILNDQGEAKPLKQVMLDNAVGKKGQEVLQAVQANAAVQGSVNAGRRLRGLGPKLADSGLVRWMARQPGVGYALTKIDQGRDWFTNIVENSWFVKKDREMTDKLAAYLFQAPKSVAFSQKVTGRFMPGATALSRFREKAKAELEAKPASSGRKKRKTIEMMRQEQLDKKAAIDKYQREERSARWQRRRSRWAAMIMLAGVNAGILIPPTFAWRMWPGTNTPIGTMTETFKIGERPTGITKYRPDFFLVPVEDDRCALGIAPSFSKRAYWCITKGLNTMKLARFPKVPIPGVPWFLDWLYQPIGGGLPGGSAIPAGDVTPVTQLHTTRDILDFRADSPFNMWVEQIFKAGLRDLASARISITPPEELRHDPALKALVESFYNITYAPDGSKIYTLSEYGRKVFAAVSVLALDESYWTPEPDTHERELRGTTMRPGPAPPP